MKILVDEEPKVCSECIFKYINHEIDKFSERDVLVYRCRLTGDSLARIYEYKLESCPLSTLNEIKGENVK